MYVIRECHLFVICFILHIFFIVDDATDYVASRYCRKGTLPSGKMIPGNSMSYGFGPVGIQNGRGSLLECMITKLRVTAYTFPCTHETYCRASNTKSQKINDVIIYYDIHP